MIYRYEICRLAAVLIVASVSIGCAATDQGTAADEPGTARDAEPDEPTIDTESGPEETATNRDGGTDKNGDACKEWSSNPEVAGQIQASELTESSGLARSLNYPSHIWTHNDSGGKARLFLLAEDGTAAGTIQLRGIDAIDWEALAYGPCPERSDRSCIFVGDIGDNDAERKSVKIHYFAEPRNVLERQSPLTVENVHSISVQYEEGPRDAEALLLHPDTGNLFIADKNGAGEVSIFRLTNTQLKTDDKMHKIDSWADFDIESPAPYGRMVTGGAFEPSGREVAFRTYGHIIQFCLKNRTFRDALRRGTYNRLDIIAPIQSEAISYGVQTDSLWLTGEGPDAPILKLSPSEDRSTQKNTTD